MQGYRLSPQQSRLWSSQRDAGASLAQCAVEVEGAVSPARLRESLRRVARRHEILRTRFVRQAGLKLPLQAVDEHAEIVWRESDASDLGEIMEREGALGFDFAAGGLLRATLVEFSPQRRVLVVTLPALCADAASLNNLFGELARLCADVETTDEPVQYVQFSEWQNEMLGGEEARAGEDFWRRQSFDDAASQALPFARGKEAGSAFRHATLGAAVGQELAARVERAAESLETSAENVYLACWQTLLWRLAGQPEGVTVGRVYGGRKFEELSGALGPFARPVPLRVNFAHGLTFAGLLEQLRDTLEEQAEWQDYFSPDFLSTSTDGDAPATRRLHYGFEYVPEAPPVVVGGLRFTLSRLRADSARFALKLTCRRAGGGAELQFGYDAARYDAAQAERLRASYLRLLEAAVLEPRREVRTLEVVGDAERERLLFELNDTRADYDREPVQRLFERQAAVTPDAVALAFEDESLTYRELNERANRLAHHLRALGVGAESVVAVMMERCVELVVGLLATLKAGAAYLPLDPSYPQQRLSFMLEDARPKVLLTQQRLRELLPEPRDINVLLLDEPASEPTTCPGDNPRVEVDANNLAYVIYTSGSTGRPKGVMVTHGGLSNYLNWSSRAYPLREGCGAPVHSPLGFDLTVTSLWNPLVTGGRVDLLREGRGIEGLAEAVLGGADYGVVKITPAHLEALRHVVGEGGEERLKTRCFVIGGEALGWEDVRYWRERHPSVRLVNEYGPTETVVGCCVFEVSSDEGEAEGGVPIGRPIANTQMYVLDERMQLVPAGVTGELYIGGAGVARGYLGRSALTAERFVPDPFCAEPGARLYKTGDLGRYLEDGNLQYLGRGDEQVKLRGYRIELGEIESALRSHEGVREAVVLALGPAGGHKHLVAYCSAREGAREVSGAALRAHLEERLPEYMVPALYVAVGRMPLTANGKIDRRALAELKAGAGEPAAEERPRTEAEETLAAIWCEVLGLERVGLHDNFFEQGGDSITSIQVIAKAAKAGLTIMPSQIFEHPTVAGLACAAAANAAAHAPDEAPPADAEPDEDDFEELLKRVEFEV